MNKFALFVFTQFVLLFSGFASVPASAPDSDQLLVAGSTVETDIAAYLKGGQVLHVDPTHLHSWNQNSDIDKTDLSEEEEETSSSSKKQDKHLQPAVAFAFARLARFPDHGDSGDHSRNYGCPGRKRHILFEVFRI